MNELNTGFLYAKFSREKLTMEHTGVPLLFMVINLKWALKWHNNLPRILWSTYFSILLEATPVFSTLLNTHPTVAPIPHRSLLYFGQKPPLVFH